MSEPYQDQSFLEFVIKSLVDNPNDVKIERRVDEMGVLMTLDVNPADMGKVIGRQGNTAKAIRTLLRVVGMKHNARVNLKINEPVLPSTLTSTSTSTLTKPATVSLDEVMADLKQ